MRTDTFEKLYVDELRDMYNAEKQLVRAIPKMAKAANSSELRSALEEHLSVTKRQVVKLEEIFKDLGRPASGKTCKGMAGILEEGQDILNEDLDEDVMDAGIIAAAQKVEHYEIASYGTLRAFARTRGDRRAAEILDEILAEEKDADKTLTRIAEASINARADGESGKMDDEDEEEDEDAPQRAAAPQARGRGKVATRPNR